MHLGESTQSIHSIRLSKFIKANVHRSSVLCLPSTDLYPMHLPLRGLLIDDY